MAEDFGVQGCGAFCEEMGAIRGVVQDHLFQVLANVAMEPPVRTDSESRRDGLCAPRCDHSGTGIDIFPTTLCVV
jgi:glucose-6-phosphate 1-dehydrogenase